MAYSFERPGFKGFRSAEYVSDETLDFLRKRYSDAKTFVIYTGGNYSRRRASLRSNALATVTEIRKPVPILDFLLRAARANGETGYDPNVVLSGLGLHAGAKPAVYLYVYSEDGVTFRAVKDIPYPESGFSKTPFRRGDIVFSVAATDALEPAEEGEEAATASDDATLERIEAAAPAPAPKSSEVRSVDLTEEAKAAALASLAKAEKGSKRRRA